MAAFQGAIDELRNLLEKTDVLSPPDSAPDWVVDDPATPVNEQADIAQLISGLLNDLLVSCGGCS